MIYLRELIRIDNVTYRVISIDVDADIAWLFPIETPKGTPKQLALSSLIAKLEAGLAIREKAKQIASSGLGSPPAMQRREARWSIIEPLIKKSAIYDKRQRNALIDARAKECGTSRQTIWALLRCYWRSGMTKQSLMPEYQARGRALENVTAGRGRPPKKGETYQLQPEDFDAFQIALSHYLSGEYKTYQEAFQRMLEKCYSVLDENRRRILFGEGERPSIAQMKHYFKKQIGESQLRKKHGSQRFDQTMREVLGTVEDACLGPGHIFEIDCTIADVALVSEAYRKYVIGRPTVCMVKDRSTGLVVGWYIGYERPSWDCAASAILMIFKNKETICRELRIEYDPADWPATGLMPEAFVADRGELAGKMSDALPEECRVRVDNLPAMRPEHKPGIECQFKLLNASVSETDGYVPSQNGQRRRGKHYEHDACLTLREFEAIFVRAIIKSNRNPITTFPLTQEEILKGQFPIPREIWARRIGPRLGALQKMDEWEVHLGLLAPDTAAITHQGIEFDKLQYLCPEAGQRNWYQSARKGRSKLEIRYDRRLVDRIFIIDPLDKTSYLVAELSPSFVKRYGGLSFAEYDKLKDLRENMDPEIRMIRLQEQSDMNQVVSDNVASARKIAKSQGVNKGQSRMAKTTAVREEALALERQTRVAADVTNTQSAQASTKPVNTSPSSACPEPTSIPSTESRQMSPNAARLLNRKAS